MLGMSERTFRRWRDRHREEGEAGLADRRLAAVAAAGAGGGDRADAGAVSGQLRGFTVKHFHEQLGKRHDYVLGYTVTKLHLHARVW